MKEHDEQPLSHEAATGHHYLMFGINMVLSLVVMYLVMFSMIDGWSDLRNNLNTACMALAMVASMGILMLATMGGMYKWKDLNTAFYLGLAALFVVAFAGTRTQALIDDRQFIASMIPHHSGAILMCREARLTDAELIDLCNRISEGSARKSSRWTGFERD